jgi:hypothetical protein
MAMNRRTFLATAAGTPAMLRAATGKHGYTWTEIEKMLDHGDLKRGALTRDDLPTPALMLDLDAFESNVSTMA